MRFSSIFAYLAILVATVNAHFQLQYPSPRGPFVQDSEPTFCDGYNSTVPRQLYPLTNAVVNLNSEHTRWIFGALVSTLPDPTTFADFNSSTGQQLAIPFFQQTGEGLFCFSFNFPTNMAGLKDGANVTLQFVFDGGDGVLYQCADLTLSSNATTPASASQNCTKTSPTATVPFPTATSKSGAGVGAAPRLVEGLLALVGFAALL